MNNINVSVIIPVYNVEKYLTTTLNSIVNQTFENYEIIIINDGSTDKSKNIISEFMDKYDNIKLITQENSGQSIARNKGIDVAKGKYIYFLDSDDYISSDALEKLFEITENNKLDLVMFNGDVFFEENFENFIKNNHYIKSKTTEKIDSGPVKFTELINNNEYTCSPCLIFFKKDLLVKNDLKFYDNIVHEDELFTFNLLLISEHVKVIKDIFFYRRIRANSTVTNKKHLKSFEGISTVVIEMEKLKKQLPIYSEDVHAAIKKLIGIKYGVALYHFVYLSRKEKKNIKRELKLLKKISNENNNFDNLLYKVFDKSKLLYICIRRVYDIIKQRNIQLRLKAKNKVRN